MIAGVSVHVMGDIAHAVFGREELPKTVIIRAGGYYPERSQLLLDQFDQVEDLRLEWCPYTYGQFRDQEYLVIFNVYGAAVTLEVLQIFKDGGVENVLFIGSMFSKNLDIGAFSLISEVLDRAGLVQLDTDGNGVVEVKSAYINQLQEFYESQLIDYHLVKIMSVPCVLHGIQQIQDDLASDESLEGVEMELSTFYHFGQKLNLNLYSFLYVSDNPTHHMMTTEVSIQELKRSRMELLYRLMLKFGSILNHVH